VKPNGMTALPETVFGGDTVHVFAGFGKAVEGSVRLTVAGQGRTSLAPNFGGRNEIDVPRIAAARRMDTATGCRRACALR
jgi:hypothetical protein